MVGSGRAAPVPGPRRRPGDAVTSEPPVRIALAGCGRIAGRVHLPALRERRDVRVVAVAETDPERREKALRDLPGAASYPDYREMLDAVDAEAVVVCLPPAEHARAAVAILGAGRHLYLEKPLATTPEEAARVVEAWRTSGSVGMMGFNYRFHPTLRRVRERVGRGELGELVAVRTAFLTEARRLPGWKRDRAAGGGALLDLGSHHVDLVRFLFGREITSVAARLDSRWSEQDRCTVRMGLSGGVSVQSLLAFGSVEEDRFEIYGTRGKLAVDRHLAAVVADRVRAGARSRTDVLRRAVRSLAASASFARKLRTPAGEPSYALALEAFVRSVRERGPSRGPSIPDIHDGYRSLAVLAAIEEAARTGATVSVGAPAPAGDVAPERSQDHRPPDRRVPAGGDE